MLLLTHLKCSATRLEQVNFLLAPVDYPLNIIVPLKEKLAMFSKQTGRDKTFKYHLISTPEGLVVSYHIARNFRGTYISWIGL